MLFACGHVFDSDGASGEFTFADDGEEWYTQGIGIAYLLTLTMGHPKLI